MTSPDSQARPVTGIDPRGPRFGAAITSAVLAIALVLGPSLGLPLLIIQTIAFGAGALFGLRYQPYGWVFRRLVRPRLAPPSALEDERPPRFAQAVGLGFALVGLAGALTGAATVFYVAVGLALVAALLNAVFDFCLGCEMYLLGRRAQATLRPATGTAAEHNPRPTTHPTHALTGKDPAMTGLIIVVIAVAVTLAFGLYRRATDGRARAVDPHRQGPRLDAARLGGDLGPTATFVQFSSPACAPCRSTQDTALLS